MLCELRQYLGGKEQVGSGPRGKGGRELKPRSKGWAELGFYEGKGRVERSVREKVHSE